MFCVGMRVPGVPSMGGFGLSVPFAVVSGGGPITLDPIVQRSGNNLTFTARRSANIANAETRSYAISGSATYLPAALASDFGGAFPSGSISFPAGAATATFVIVAVANAQPE
jgi:hypothetical protein